MVGLPPGSAPGVVCHPGLLGWQHPELFPHLRYHGKWEVTLTRACAALSVMTEGFGREGCLHWARRASWPAGPA